MIADSFSANPYNHSVLKSQQSEALKNIILHQGDYQRLEFSDKDSACSVIGLRNRRDSKTRNTLRKSAGGITKKGKSMDYTNYAYNEAVGRLKVMLAESYFRPKNMRNLYEEPADNFSDSVSVIERPVLSDISKYLSPSQKARLGVYRPRKTFSNFSTSKENLVNEPTASSVDYYTIRSIPQQTPLPTTNNVTAPAPAPVEIFDFIEKQEDYIEQLEKESKYCRSELSNLLEKVKDVINENEILTETARTDLAALSGYESDKLKSLTASSESDENLQSKKCSTLRKKNSPRSSRYANAPTIVFEARISELEAELMQSQIDLKRFKQENEELKRKLANADPISTLGVKSSVNCDSHRKQIENLQQEKARLEGTVLKLQQSLDEAKSEQLNGISSKRYVNELMQMERSQAELEVKHLRDELDRQHERVRELQHEMTRRIAEERSNAERRYNTQVDQLGGDLSSQWEQVTKLQLELERQKRYESDLKRDLTSRTAQIEELKMELRSNRSTFLADMAQINAEKQSLEQEITALRLQIDRGAREHKTEASRLNAEINSLRQRLDRGDADLLHSKREVLRLNDEIANLEKELAYGELKNEIRPTKKDLDKRISEMQDKHAETVNELEEMIQSQKQLMDKLTNECRILTKKLEETTIKNNTEKKALRETNQKLLERLKEIWASYKELQSKPINNNLTESLSESETDREEHISQSLATHNIATKYIKPLSTTSRPHLARPTPPTQHWTTIQQQNNLHTQLEEQIHMSAHNRPTSQQPQQQNTKTQMATSVDSMNMTKKISKTELKMKNNEMCKQQIKLPQTMKIARSMESLTAVKPNKKQILVQKNSEPLTTMPVATPVMKTTINNNTILVPMTGSTMATNNTMLHKSTVIVTPTEQLTPITITQQDQLTIIKQMPINMIQQQEHQEQQQQQQHRICLPTPRRHPQQALKQPLHQQSNQSQVPQANQTLAMEVQQFLREAPLQKAALNRERATWLWGQEVPLEQSAEENPLCHNSLPRPLPKSSLTMNDLLDPLQLTYDPENLNLEFSISSASLMRSFDSTDTYIIDNPKFNSLTDMSISPPPPLRTAFRRSSATDETDTAAVACNI